MVPQSVDFRHRTGAFFFVGATITNTTAVPCRACQRSCPALSYQCAGRVFIALIVAAVDFDVAGEAVTKSQQVAL